MKNDDTIEILELMMNGIDPLTGEVLPYDHLCNYPSVMRALHNAIMALSEIPIPAENRFINKNGRLNAGRPWTNEDIEELQYLYYNETPIDDICNKLQRRKRGVLKQLKLMGIITADQIPTSSFMPKYERTGKPWTPQEETYLNDLYIDRWTIFEIAQEMQRSEYSIYCRMIKLGLTGEQYGYPSKDEVNREPDTQKESLKKLYQEGKSIAELAVLFGISEKSISARLFYMGLIKESPISYLKRKK